MMGFFSLKDVNKSGKFVLYYQFYSSVNYERQKKKWKPGAKSGTTYQNMSRNNISISLGRYKPVIDERYLKSIAMEKAIIHLEKGNITEEDLMNVGKEFKENGELEENLFQEYAFIQFKLFLDRKGMEQELKGMTEADKQEAFMLGKTFKDWADITYKQSQEGVIDDIKEELGVGPKKAKIEYFRRKFEELRVVFTDVDEKLASAAENKINKLSRLE